MSNSPILTNTVLRNWLGAAALAVLGACSGESGNAGSGGDPTDVFAGLSAECQTPLAKDLAKISIHANDPLMEANLDLANRCGKEMALQFRERNPVTKADRIITPIDGLINFETPHVHPIDLTPDGNTLVAVNTAAHLLEVWQVNGSTLTAVASIPVGQDPVSVRARSNTEVWVVNQISDSVSIVDLTERTVVRTLITENEPADVVFAGTNRAFVSASEANAVNVFDLNNLNAAPQRLSINGEEPRALAVSADGQTVFAAVFESGNGTRQTGGFGGGGTIVRDNQQADNDVAIINASNLAVTYRRRLMNMVMAIDVHPLTQRVHVVGTEAFNDIPNEPALNGKFIKVHMADFTGSGLSGSTVTDLNPHLDYSTATVSSGLREQSLGDPRGIAWRASGQRAFVTGMGSNNVIVIDASGNRVANFDVGQGPTGIVLKDAAGLGFVMNKFAGSISVINLDSLSQVSEVAFDDPTPAQVKAGRPFIYDTRLTSGTGHLSCASCHVDSRTDRLGWQLSDGQNTQSTIPRASNSLPGNVIGTSTISSNKQVMVTQTLLDIMEHPRFHWRGDRASIDEFNGTFVNLMGRSSQISQSQMDAMKDFLRTLWLPPNPYRTISNTRPTTVTLPDGSTATSNRVGAGTTDALRGGGNTNNCLICHSGQAQATRNFGANPEISSNIIAPALPGLYDKMGSTFGRTGFGFFHHGGADLFAATRTREFLAEILTLEGPEGPLTEGEIRQAPHAGVGQQVTLGSSPDNAQNARLDQLITIANASIWTDLVAHIRIGGIQRGFVLQSGNSFDADSSGETATKANLLASASDSAPVTFTLVAAGTSTRQALDSNLDGVLNNDTDTDGDGLVDAIDPDDDNDGVNDGQDAFPLDPTETLDTDGDGIGNNADTDDDGDGVGDGSDAFPLDATESVDTDGDGIGNNADTDDDNDGVGDAQDAFPLDANESVDTDGDGIGNNTDTDDDGDGVLDTDDLDPLDPNIGAGGGGDACNLFTDGGFESGAGNWFSNTTPTVVAGARTGAGALNFDNGFLGQVFDATAGTQYTFSGFYQSSGSTGWAGFGVDFVDANGDEVGELVRTLEVASTWTAFSLDAPIPVGAAFIRPWFYAQSGRAITLDDIDLRKTGCSDGNVGNQPPFVANPGNQVGAVGDSVSLAVSAVDPDSDPVTFSATNLPAGLVIGPNNGVISGLLGTDGASNVTVFANDGENTGQTSFVWTVTDPNGGGNCNALSNGSFESGLAGWSSSVNPAVVNDAAVGASAARFSGGWISITLPGAGATDYSFTGQYKSTAGAGWSGFGIDYLDGVGNEIGEEVRTLNAATSYTPFVLSATSPVGTASVRIWFYADADRQLTLDAVDLRESGCTGNGGGNGNACNAVTNSGFETNTAGWFTNTAPALVADAGEGAQAVSISGGWISHVMPVIPGVDYTATALTKSSGISGWSGTGLDFVDGNGNKLADSVQTIEAGSAYGPVSLNGVAPTGAVEVQFWFYADATRTTQVDAVDFRVTGCTSGG